MALEPITREEKFMAMAAGEDVGKLTPITRQEMFLKQIADSAGGGGGGGTGGEGGTVSISYEQVFDHNYPFNFNGFSVTGEQAQKLADANEIYMYADFGSVYGKGNVRVSVNFRFAEGRSHSFSCVLEDRETDAGVEQGWIVKLTKLDSATYILEDSLYANSYPVEERQMRKFILSSEMPFGDLPSLTMNVMPADGESQAETPSFSARVTIFARSNGTFGLTEDVKDELVQGVLNALPTWEGGAY